MKIETVVFDLGGVLVDWNPRYMYRSLFTDEKEMEQFLAEVCKPEWNEMQDAGRSFEEGIQELLRTHPEKESHIRAFFDRWIEMIRGPIQGTVKILEEIHRNKEQRLFALSNWSAETFPLAYRRFDFLKLFEKIVVSGEEKMIKPDPRFFRLLETRHGVTPEHSVFIDDVERNIEGARALGYHTILFKDPASLRATLSNKFKLNYLAADEGRD